MAACLGAWAVGFVFAPSPRRVTIARAAELVAAARDASAGGAGGPLSVGVFVDESPEQIAAAVAEAGLDAVQLHGPRPGAPAVRAALRDLAREVQVIQAIAVPAVGMAADALGAAVAAAARGADLLLFDTCAHGKFGGTGTPFLWGTVRRAAGDTPFLVAGGLGAQNVRQALAASGAAGVDVSSGVERSPGVKDREALRSLFAALADMPDRAGGGREAPPQDAGKPQEGRRP